MASFTSHFVGNASFSSNCVRNARLASFTSPFVRYTSFRSHCVLNESITSFTSHNSHCVTSHCIVAVDFGAEQDASQASGLSYQFSCVRHTGLECWHNKVPPWVQFMWSDLFRVKIPPSQKIPPVVLDIWGRGLRIHASSQKIPPLVLDIWQQAGVFLLGIGLMSRNDAQQKLPAKKAFKTTASFSVCKSVQPPSQCNSADLWHN